MNIDGLLRQIEHSIKEVLAGRPDFTGSLTLTVNFLDGEPKDIIKEIEKQRMKIK